MENYCLVGVEDAHRMTLGYAEALRSAGCYLEMDSSNNVWIYRERGKRA